MRARSPAAVALAILALAAGCIPTFGESYGDPALDEQGNSAVPLADGSHVVAGRAGSDIALLHLAADGARISLRSYGPGEATDAVADTDGTIVVSGELEGAARLSKLEVDGSVAWDRTYSGGLRREYGAAVAIAPGGYVLAGGTDPSDAAADSATVVYAVDPTGRLRWRREIRVEVFSSPTDVALALDGDVVVVGAAWPPASVKLFMLRLAPDGTERWRSVGTEPGLEEPGGWLVEADGAVVVSGALDPGDGPWRYFLRRVEADGTPAGTLLVGPPLRDLAWTVDLARSHEGDYVVVGTEYDLTGGATTTWLGRIDRSGRLVWEHEWPPEFLRDARDLAPTPDGGYLLVGQDPPTALPPYDLWAVKTDASGRVR